MYVHNKQMCVIICLFVCCVDSIGCDNLTSVSNDDHSLHCVRFSWGQSKMAVLAIKLNCLSTEFALKKHGQSFIGIYTPTDRV